ncbi:MAG: hypothetical protein K0R17_1665 [Rariglobus sp.]|jgi:hypothetical protein|nr:hypothetical protein [Rariglobus sp.]
MHCFSLILGARNTPGAGRRFSKKDDAMIRDLTAQHFPAGFTILNAGGGWFDPARKLFVEEEARQVLICTSSVRALREWCAALAGALRQKELLLVELGVARTFRYKNPRRLHAG